MLKEQFVASDRIISNYFVPFTSGKFVMSCLMLHKEVYPALTQEQLFGRITANARDWTQVEYSDIDFWWKEYNWDWFHQQDTWYDNIADEPKAAVANGQYIFYSVHEAGTTKFMTNLFPNSRILVIVPDEALCKKNYLSKNRNTNEPIFETSRVYRDLKNFVRVDTDLVFHQKNIYDTGLFVANIKDLANKLKINLDMDLVIKYREHYLNSSFNK